MKKQLLLVLNFLDLILKVEDVRDYKMVTLNNFTILIRLFENAISYGLTYVIIKIIQFVFLFFLRIPLENISLIYLVLPCLILIEIGLSRLYVGKLKNLLMFICRAVVKFGIFYGIDQLMLYLFG